jgi:hypothetical protein
MSYRLLSVTPTEPFTSWPAGCGSCHYLVYFCALPFAFPAGYFFSFISSFFSITTISFAPPSLISTFFSLLGSTSSRRQQPACLVVRLADFPTYVSDDRSWQPPESVPVVSQRQTEKLRLLRFYKMASGACRSYRSSPELLSKVPRLPSSSLCRKGMPCRGPRRDPPRTPRELPHSNHGRQRLWLFAERSR